MKNKPKRKQITFKDFGWIWYLKEIGWALLVWLFISQVYDLLPYKLNVAISMFAILVASFWVRAVATRDSALNKLFSGHSGRLLRHAVIISIFAMIVAWVIAILIVRIPGWEFL